jgi:UDP:flavonoid glycosyltransferase YjiC (YdhE family)
MVLGRLGCPVVAAFPGWGQLPVGDRKRIESPTLLVHEGPLSMAQATQEAQRAVGNGGLGFTHAMLAAGRPLALLPHDVEKALTTRRVIAANAGISLDGCNDALALEHRLREWLHDSQTLTSAMQLAEKYAQASPADLPVRFAQRCYSLLKSVAV